MNNRIRLTRAALLCLIFLGVGACGYSFQGTRNPLLDSEGIRTIYVKPLRNDTYKAGAGILVYNQVLKTIAAGGRVRLVSNPELADAVLEGVVQSAAYRPTNVSRASDLFPQVGSNLIPTPVISLESSLVAFEYVASMSCSFRLVKSREGSPKTSKRGAVLWSAGFAKSAPFPANNQLGIFGNTSPLINESEFDRALLDVAQVMSRDVHEAMLAMF